MAAKAKIKQNNVKTFPLQKEEIAGRMSVRRFVLHRRVWKGKDTAPNEWEPFIVCTDEVFQVAVEIEVAEDADMILRMAAGRALWDEDQ